MKFRLQQPLRRNGVRHQAGSDIDLDPQVDAAEIDRLAGLGVIQRPAADQEQGGVSGMEGGVDGSADGDQQDAGAADVAALSGSAPGAGENAPSVSTPGDRAQSVADAPARKTAKSTATKRAAKRAAQ